MSVRDEGAKLVSGEVVELVVCEADRPLVLRRADGSMWEAAGGLPSGYRVVDYFSAGRYLGPDSEGVEPRFRRVD